MNIESSWNILMDINFKIHSSEQKKKKKKVQSKKKKNSSEQKKKKITLPEGEEDDALDGEELDDGVEGLEELPGAVVEEEEAVEGQGHGDVVDDGDVEVAPVDAPVPVPVLAEGLQDDGHESHHGLHEAELQGGLLTEPEEPDGVVLALEAAGAVQAGGSEGGFFLLIFFFFFFNSCP